MKESLVEKFTPRVRKHSKDSGGECSNYTLGLGEKFNTPTMATVGSPDLPVYTSCSSLSSSQNVGPPCRQQFPGCQVVLNDEGLTTHWPALLVKVEILDTPAKFSLAPCWINLKQSV